MNKAQRPPISQRAILAFWLPMAGTWLMMAAEAPFLAALIARLPSPMFNLAAFGVAYAIAILVESPVIMILSAATALVGGPVALIRLRLFARVLNAAVTVGMGLLVLTPAWDVVAQRGIGLEREVADLARGALWILLPWPAAIGYRRFYQGLLIRSGKTRLVAYGTVARLLAMASCGAALHLGTELPGAWVGAGAISFGVLVEAIVARIMSRVEVRRVLALPHEGDAAPTYAGIARFYFPLALTSMIGLSAQPMTTFFVAGARLPIESLAVLPVVHSLSFLFRAAGLSYQEVALALLARGRDHLAPVGRFALKLGLAASLGQAAIAFTPLSDWWLLGVSGLEPRLAGIALLPIQLLALAPALSVMQALQRSLLVHTRQTRLLTVGTVIEVTGILAGLLLTVRGLAMIGATAAAVSFLVGRLAGNLFLVPPCLRYARESRAAMENRGTGAA